MLLYIAGLSGKIFQWSIDMIFANKELMQQALCLCRLWLFAAAAALLTAGCGPDPEVKAENLNNAVESGKAGNWQDCEKYSLAVLEDDPAEPNALLLRAIASEQLGKLDIARESARRAAENAPKSFAAQYTYGRLLSMRPDSTENAIRVLKRALELRPDDNNTLMLLGLCCSKINSDEAIRYFLALPIEVRKDPAVQTHMAIYYLLRKNTQSNAHKLVETALGNAYRIDPKNPEVVLNIARYLDHYRKSRYAINYYRDYLKMTEGDPAQNTTRAQVKARINKLR